LLAVLGLVVGCWAAMLAQTTPAGQAAPGAQAPATTPNFTGGARGVPSTDLRTVRFQYDAAARSYWHTHDGLQLMLLEVGKGRYQIQGQKMLDMLPGQPIFLPAGVPHWHGAAPDQGMTLIAVNIGSVKWGAEVSEAEYMGRK
jgi:quercetin dioxygenase-like cupin family protein